MLNKIISLILLSILGGILGTYAGADETSKGIRRFGIPGILMIIAWLNLHNWLVLFVMLLSFGLSLGYGIPCGTDKGSTLGRFWYKIFRGNKKLSNIFTRGAIALVLNIGLLIIPIIKGNWFIYMITGITILLNHSLLSWRNWGTFKFLNKNLNWIDFVVYIIFTGSALCLILI